MEEQKELNLVEILKDCPKGTKLWCPAYGNMYLERISSDTEEYWPIECIRGEREDTDFFDIRGKLWVSEDAECMLFPSKDNRDWSTFKAPKPKWNPDTLQPFDKVLVKDNEDDIWRGDFFLYKQGKIPHYPYICIRSEWRVCIPYNEETKHLLGTNQEAPEYYRV